MEGCQTLFSISVHWIQCQTLFSISVHQIQCQTLFSISVHQIWCQTLFRITSLYFLYLFHTNKPNSRIPRKLENARGLGEGRGPRARRGVSKFLLAFPSSGTNTPHIPSLKCKKILNGDWFQIIHIAHLVCINNAEVDKYSFIVIPRIAKKYTAIVCINCHTDHIEHISDKPYILMDVVHFDGQNGNLGGCTFMWDNVHVGGEMFYI